MVAQKSTDFNEVFTVRLSDEPYMRYYEHHPPHLINVGTLPSESRNTENVILQWDITKEIASNVSYSFIKMDL